MQPSHFPSSSFPSPAVQAPTPTEAGASQGAEGGGGLGLLLVSLLVCEMGIIRKGEAIFLLENLQGKSQANFPPGNLCSPFWGGGRQEGIPLSSLKRWGKPG